MARRRLEKNCALDRERTLGRGEGGAVAKTQCGIREQRGGGSGLYRVRGKVGGRQTREIGHRLARPLAGLPSPRDLHTMEHPQTPFTPNSSYLLCLRFDRRLFTQKITIASSCPFILTGSVMLQLQQKGDLKLTFDTGGQYFGHTTHREWRSSK